jgi:rhomboid family GlyGly-CTERM serine protease
MISRCLLGAALILAVAQLIGIERLQYQRANILDGELWRLASGHLVHLGWGHAMLNFLGLALTVVLFPGVAPRVDGAWIALGSALAIDAGLLAFQPEIHWYVGLSGVLHGLLTGASVITWRRWENRVLLALVVAKVVWEQFFGALPATADLAGGPVIVDAHLYGALGGLITGMLLRLHQSAPKTL